MTERSPASVIHATVEPSTSSYDAGDAATSTANITHDNHDNDDNQPPQPAQTDADDRDDTTTTTTTTETDISPATADDNNESSTQASKPLADTVEGAAHNVDKLKLSTLKELTVVSIRRDRCRKNFILILDQVLISYHC